MTAEWLWNLALFVIGFFILVKGAHWLVEGGSSLAKALGVSDLLIGLTVVAFGTSLPEMFVDVTAAIQGNTGIVVGNIIGSNITNILFILGISAIIFPLKIQRNTTWKEIPFTLLAAVAVFLLGNDKIIQSNNYSQLGRADGLILLSFFAVYLYYVISIGKNASFEQKSEIRGRGIVKQLMWIIIGLVGLFLGSRAIVTGAVFVARQMHVSETLIGLTVIAWGTTLPELTASIVAALKKRPDLALGNIVGSNIANIFLILGVCSVVRPLPLRAQDNFAIGVAILASFLLFISAFVGKRNVIDRWVGMVFILGYLFYLVVVVRLG